MAAGGFVAVHAWRTLSIGTLASSGPGMFPFALGWILAMLGLAIFLPGLWRAAPAPRFDLRSFVYVALSIVAFALVLPRFGLVPATVVSVLLSARAENGASFFWQLVLAVSLALLGTLVFIVGLGMTVSPFKWPW